MSATTDLLVLGSRLRGRLSDTDRDFVDHASRRVDDVRSDLVAGRRLLDDVTTRVTLLEGRTPPSRPAPDWPSTRARAVELIAVWDIAARRRRELALLTGVAAGEQLLETLTEPEGAPGWFAEVLDRFPNVEPGTIAALVDGGDDAAIEGAMLFIRGFRGEQLVAAAFLGGDLPVPPGTTGAALADATNEPGLDLRLDVAGETVDAQVKISSSAGPILEHFARHPDVEIVYTSSDAADAVEGLRTAARESITVVRAGDPWPDIDGPIVVDMSIDSEALTSETLRAFDGAVVDADGGFLSDLIDELPVIALGLIAFRAVRRYVATEEDTSAIRSDAIRSTGNVLINAGIGTGIAMATGVALLKAPSTLAVGLVRQTWRSSQASIEESTHRVRTIRRHLERLTTSSS